MEGNVIGASTIARDISTIRKLQHDLLKKNQALENSYPRLELAEQLFENVKEGIVITDAEGRIQRVNSAFVCATGYSVEELTQGGLRILRSGRQEDDFYKALWQSLKSRGHWSGEIWNRKRDGTEYLDWLSISAIQNVAGKTAMYAGIYRDLTERFQYEQALRHQAFHDVLTGLPNRLFFHQKLEEALQLAKEEGTMLWQPVSWI